MNIEERVARIETKQEDFEKRFESFCNNEFCHLRKKVDWIFTLLIATLGGLIVDLALVITKVK